jgi:hypothetical protein
MPSAYLKISTLTKALKSKFAAVYATYAFSFYGGLIGPRAFLGYQISYLTSKFTLAFSNTPGPIKPLFYIDPRNNNKIFSCWT